MTEEKKGEPQYEPQAVYVPSDDGLRTIALLIQQQQVDAALTFLVTDGLPRNRAEDWLEGFIYGHLYAASLERERCAKVVETALRLEYKSKTGVTRGLSEAEVFMAAAIRAPVPVLRWAVPEKKEAAPPAKEEAE